MERYQYLRSLISQLLEDLPLLRTEVVEDVRYLMSVGEEELAFETMCSWIYEDSLAISRQYYERLASVAQEIGSQRALHKLDELIEK
ncbi:MafI family immunity protein [Melissospora conviva]|uniref:MafI family immunity protein n=1 Tax=Melissospora conviva TaxID=3388432 RepID=UPI003C1784DA